MPNSAGKLQAKPRGRPKKTVESLWKNDADGAKRVLGTPGTHAIPGVEHLAIRVQANLSWSLVWRETRMGRQTWLGLGTDVAAAVSRANEWNATLRSDPSADPAGDVKRAREAEREERRKPPPPPPLALMTLLRRYDADWKARNLAKTEAEAADPAFAHPGIRDKLRNQREAARKGDLRRAEMHLPPALQEHDAQALTSADVVAFLGTKWDTERATMRMLRIYLCHAYEWGAKQVPPLVSHNPATYAVEADAFKNRPVAVKHRAFLRWERVPLFMVEVRRRMALPYPKHLRDKGFQRMGERALYFAVLNPQRGDEIVRASWGEFHHLDDATNAYWLIPPLRMKRTGATGQGSHLIFLSRQAIAFLLEMRQVFRARWGREPTDQDFVFYADAPTKQICPTAMIQVLRKRMKIDLMTQHGLRTTCKTGLLAWGYPPKLTGKLLAHETSSMVERAYEGDRAGHAHSEGIGEQFAEPGEVDPKTAAAGVYRPAMQHWSDWALWRVEGRDEPPQTRHPYTHAEPDVTQDVVREILRLAERMRALSGSKELLDLKVA